MTVGEKKKKTSKLQQLLFVPGCGELHPASIPTSDASTLGTCCLCPTQRSRRTPSHINSPHFFKAEASPEAELLDEWYLPKQSCL